MNRVFTIIIVLSLWSAPINAQEDDITLEQSYVESNMVAIFYHELGHALIDVLEIPVFGQEEDAADVLSILMVDLLWESESADAIAYDTAYSYFADAEKSGEIDELAFWDVHGLDLQRYYNLICLHYGGDIEGRADFAEETGLPEERAETCQDERDLADRSWQKILDGVMPEHKEKDWIGYDDHVRSDDKMVAAMSDVLATEVRDLNEWLALGKYLQVSFTACDQVNAFYDPSVREITICSEFVDHLVAQYQD